LLGALFAASAAVLSALGLRAGEQRAEGETQQSKQWRLDP
jgi:hypothetical protein